jgi:hypothetical protein
LSDEDKSQWFARMLTKVMEASCAAFVCMLVYLAKQFTCNIYSVDVDAAIALDRDHDDDHGRRRADS